MMWSVRWLPGAPVVLALFLAGCAGTQLAVHTAKEFAGPGDYAGPGVAPPKAQAGEYKIGQPYRINGVWYYPRIQPGYNHTGIASWYGQPFHGRPTANGEVFDMNRLTAAHRTLPLPVDIRVTNLENGRSILLRVNDRGPFVAGRIVDVSRRAAELLGFAQAGTAKVRVQLVGGGDRSFVLARKPISAAEKATVVAAPRERVRVAALPPPTGIDQAPPTPNRQLPRPASSSAPQTGWLPSGTNGRQVTIQPVEATEIYVQVGAFSIFQNANRLRAKLSVIGKPKIDHVLVDDRDIFRIRFGPVATVDRADRILDRVIRMGHPEARIIVD